MAKSFTFNDLLTKLANVFKKDVYFLDGKFCLGGVESESKNKTFMMCVLTEESTRLVQEKFPNHTVIFMENIKEFKKDESSSLVKFDLSEEELKEYQERKERLQALEQRTTEWDTFHFTEEQINTLFNEAGLVEVFRDTEYPPVMLGKCLFPLMTKTNTDRLYYHVYLPEENEDLVEMITVFDTDWFQIYNLIQYVQL